MFHFFSYVHENIKLHKKDLIRYQVKEEQIDLIKRNECQASLNIKNHINLVRLVLNN